MIECRNLSLKNLEIIQQNMNKFNLTYLDNDAVVEFKWENIKNAIQIEVNNKQ